MRVTGAVEVGGSESVLGDLAGGSASSASRSCEEIREAGFCGGYLSSLFWRSGGPLLWASVRVAVHVGENAPSSGQHTGGLSFHSPLGGYMPGDPRTSHEAHSISSSSALGTESLKHGALGTLHVCTHSSSLLLLGRPLLCHCSSCTRPRQGTAGNFSPAPGAVLGW